MKNIILCILCFITFLFADKPLYGNYLINSAMVISSTDITNINKTNYNVYLDANDTIITPILTNQNINLCENKKFKKYVGEYNCKRNITYKISTLDSADIIITETGLTKSGKTLIVCTNEFSGCDLIIKGKQFIINKEQIEAKGFIMDPNLKKK